MDVKRQHETHAAEYEEAALRTLRSGRYIGGDEVTEFEREFAAYEGASYGIACGNGTDAILLALRALRIGQGDEVITVAMTFFATAEGIAAVGAKPVFVDVDPESLCMDPDLVEAAITERTKAILAVHFYGNSLDMDALRAIANKHGLYLIADCAQSAGTKYRGTRKGTLGDVSCFSFFPTKNLGCAGDGGMVLTDSEEIASACRSLRAHGSGKNGLDTLRRTYQKAGEPLPEDMPLGETKYYNYLIGYNTRMDAIQAAILRVKLRYLDEFVEARRGNAEFYRKALAGTAYILPAEPDYSEHSYYIFALRHERAPKVMKKLTEAGIGNGTYYPVPLHLQGAFLDLGYRPGDLPVTESLCAHSFAIPVYPELAEEERQYIVENLIRIDREL